MAAWSASGKAGRRVAGWVGSLVSLQESVKAGWKVACLVDLSVVW